MSFLSHCLYLSIGFFAGFVIVFLYYLWKGVKERLEASRSESAADAEQASDAGERIVNPPKSHPMCLAMGHSWDAKATWVIYTIPTSEIAWQVGIRPEYKREQHCTRKGCCGYRIQIKREGGKVRNVPIA